MFYTPESSVWCLHDKPFRFGINIRYSTRLSLNYSQSHIILFLFHKNKSRSSSWNRKSCVSYFTHPRQWPALSICCWFDIHLIHCGHCCLSVKKTRLGFFYMVYVFWLHRHLNLLIPVMPLYNCNCLLFVKKPEMWIFLQDSYFSCPEVSSIFAAVYKWVVRNQSVDLDKTLQTNTSTVI